MARSELLHLPTRLKALIIKLLGIKGFIWVVGTLFLWFGKISSTDWVLLSCGFGCLNVGQKYLVPQQPVISKENKRGFDPNNFDAE